jgi:endonuclease G
MKKTLLLVTALVSLLLAVYPQAVSTSAKKVTHHDYDVYYDMSNQHPVAVSYVLRYSDPVGSGSRKNCEFGPDPKILAVTDHASSYKGSGYDRGHLKPAGDSKKSQRTMDETFYYSNACPQTHSFNAGIWLRLEELTRQWAGQYKKLYIIAGPIYTKDLGKTGKVPVPDYFYKSILRINKSGDTSLITFLIPHAPTGDPIESFVVTTDSVENMTALDLFWKLPDSLETSLESKTNKEKWFDVSNVDAKYLDYINTADEEALMKLNGIGSTLAYRILEYRTENGNFTTLDQLDDIKGIGQKTIEKVKESIDAMSK